MQIDLNETLKLGIEAHQTGDLAAAEAAYLKILEIAPGHADAMHLSGLVSFQKGNHKAAIQKISKAIEFDAKVSLYHANLARVSLAYGEASNAVKAFKEAVQLEPDNAILHSDLASALLQAGDGDAARARANLALELDPGLAEAHLNLGLALQTLYGSSHQEAITAFQRALALNPFLAGAHLALGVAWHEQGEIAKAIKAYEEAIRLHPGYVEAHCNLGNIDREQLNFEGAIKHYRNALAIQPEQPVVWGNLGVALQEMGNINAAIEAYDQAISFDPEAPDIRRNRGMALLASGRYEDGWSDYEYRLKTKRFLRLDRLWPVPMWDARDLMGKRVLVHAEQGLGDTLQFCRYLPMLRERGAMVIVECADSLKPLIELMPAVRSVIRPGEHLPAIDFHVSMMSLPGLLKTTLDTIPASVPYLSAPKVDEMKWKKRLAGWPKGRRIGIAWRGSADHPRDAIRSPGLAQFMVLASLPGVTLVSLQKVGGAEEIATLPGAEKIIDPTAQLSDFGDTAALIGQLDFIVSCDSAPLHLAGAMGVQGIAVLPHVAEWRWGTEGERSPWYPSLTLLRQPDFGDWHSVFVRVTQMLAQGH